MTKKTIDTLVQDIYAYLEDPTKEGYLNDEDVDALAKEIALVLKKRASERKRDGFTLRLSNYGTPPRKLWFDAHKDYSRKSIRGSTLIKFLYGDIIEAMVLFLIKQAGHSVTMEQEEIEVKGIKGHLDAIVDEDTVVDVKSASKWSFAKKFKGGAVLTKSEDTFGYIPQIKGYQFATDKPNSAFIAACKETGELWMLPVQGDYAESLDPEHTMERAKEVINLPAPPEEKCYPDEKEGESGNRSLATPCTFCANKFECWGDQLRAFEYSNGIKYFTKVVKRPANHIPDVTEQLKSQLFGTPTNAED